MKLLNSGGLSGLKFIFRGRDRVSGGVDSGIVSRLGGVLGAGTLPGCAPAGEMYRNEKDAALRLESLGTRTG